MNESILKIRMFGELTLTLDDHTISEEQNRTRKMWNLMAYILYNRGRTVSQEELLDLMWNNSERHNPVSAMKTAMHRTRALMDDFYPNAGHDLILKAEGGYTWNTQFPMELDIDRFEQLCQLQNGTEEELLEQWLCALDLYRGNFLSRMSSELWVIPVATYYQNLYVKTALKVLPLLKQRGNIDQAAALARQVLDVDPCSEAVSRHLMQILIDQGNQKEAMALYDELSRRLSADYDLLPEDATRALFREAMQTVGVQYLPPELVQTHLKEEEGLTGPMVCDYTFFRMLCHAQARAMMRVDMEAHVALLSITDRNGKPLPKPDRDLSMKQLEDQIRTNLRRGDAIARCSGSQYVILLPYASYDNSCKVCERILQAYIDHHPQDPAVIQYMVHTLEPYS
ncbi:MAG: tetratricopeptide repeat protein [Firmicutes bacterium]|nr:tetratricopeptide repeat protein [Bacillota bacterium]